MVLWPHCEAARYDEMADQQTKTSCCKEDVWLSSLPIICSSSSSLCSAFKRNGSFFFLLFLISSTPWFLSLSVLAGPTSAVKRSIIGSELNTVSPGMSAHNRRTVHKFGRCGVIKYYI